MVQLNNIPSIFSLSVSLLWVILAGCNESHSSTETNDPPISYNLVMADSLVIPFPYALSTPDQTIKLPRFLQEVSGLSYVGTNTLAMLHDEAGFIYMLDISSGTILGQYNIKRKGDFEGVEIIRDTAYMLRSDGTIYEAKGFAEKEPEVIKHETFLSSSNDTEGLGYDPHTNSLLVACKEPAAINGKELKRYRGIHSFNLQTHQLSEKPFVLLDLGEVKAFLQAHTENEGMQMLAKNFNPNSKSSFKPSGIAVHPISGYLYVIATNGELMIVLNREHQVVQVQQLPRSIFSQPEGICFNSEGDLFISNEGRNKAGNVLRFSYHPNL